jgi:GT2 family glycosyltransferase
LSFTVVIPSRNPINLAACVNAVRANEPDAPIRVVWDRSKGNGPAPAGDYSVTEVDQDFIFAHNVNRGIMDAGTDDVVILGDDGLLRTPGGFSLLSKVSAACPEYGIISATMNNVGNSNQWPAGVGLRQELRVVCFVCVYVPRSTIDLVGLMDERFTAYGFDDDDYCLRTRMAGLKLGIHDGCYVDHGALTSTFRGNPAQPANLTDGHRIFVEKWGRHPL